MSNGDILVIGSMNMDLVVQTGRYPDKGETIIGKDFDQIPGGKGANQALAVGKLGGSVSFIGACGNDNFGDELLSSLKTGGVNVDNVFRVEENTGIAAITVEEDGDNRIIVVSGANSKLSSSMIDKLEDEIKEVEAILLQMEIPLKTIVHTIELAHQYQTTVILDPAPAQELPEDIYEQIDYLLPNEGELELLLQDYNLTTTQEQVDQLLDWGVGTILLTRGKNGIILYTKGRQEHYKAIEVEAVDTTAAGDSFAGAFAYGLQQGWSEEKAIKFGNQVAALVVTKLGAQSSLPTIEDVEEFKQERGLE
ncbi:ribokinase [Selenihalanaerobacter shriftii]|uniref:Ribokinase n=1 Tax=Selenihalanaerobacter shriftii TaxID=142842 RepID=A0A1T4JRK5_9FIRM|nr:ribokinase [Selenihalanaerobacter shriftii]SJZ32788.1 ribokinase [Selenihalanaerobacter shriftii]